jgi:hypothetical protein
MFSCSWLRQNPTFLLSVSLQVRNSATRTGPEPIKPAGPTGSQGLPVQSGHSNRYWPVPSRNQLFSSNRPVLYSHRTARKVRGFANFFKKVKKKRLNQQLLTMKTFPGWIWIPKHIKRMCALMLQLYLCLLDQGNQARLRIPLLSLLMLRM